MAWILGTGQARTNATVRQDLRDPLCVYDAAAIVR